MKVEVSGTRNGKLWPRRGEVVDLPDTEGADLCAAGLAEPVADTRVEKAVAPPAEMRKRAVKG